MLIVLAAVYGNGVHAPRGASVDSLYETRLAVSQVKTHLRVAVYGLMCAPCDGELELGV